MERDLTPEEIDWIMQKAANGEYEAAHILMRDALGLLEEQNTPPQLKQ